jgi:hypothetical protein
MPGHQSTIGIRYGLKRGLAYHSQLPGGQKDFSALVIIPFAFNYSYDMEEGARHEEI